MSDPDRRSRLESVITTYIDTYMKDIHTIMPGQIVKFDPVTQLADVQPELKRNINGNLINLPVLTSVPVRFLKSGDFTICFPLKIGDEVAIYIIERSIDNWLENGGIQSPDDTRKFDLSDAYIVPILYSQEQKIDDFDPENLVIKSTNNKAKITLTSDGNISICTTGETTISSSKTTINNDLFVNGDVISSGMLKGIRGEFTTSLKVGVSELLAHFHGGVSSGGSNTAPLV